MTNKDKYGMNVEVVIYPERRDGAAIYYIDEDLDPLLVDIIWFSNGDDVWEKIEDWYEADWKENCYNKLLGDIING